MERFVLARGQSALQVLSVRKRPGERRIGDACVAIQQTGGAHADQLTLQVVDDPGGGQGNGVPREADGQTRRTEHEEPARLDLGAGQTVDVPAAAEAADMLESRRELAAEGEVGNWCDGVGADADFRKRGLYTSRIFFRDDKSGCCRVSRRGPPHGGRELDVRAPHVVEVARNRMRRVGFVVWAGHDVDHDLKRRVEAVEHAAERDEPTAAIVLGCTREADRRRFEYGESGRAVRDVRDEHRLSSREADHGRERGRLNRRGALHLS
ncbi:MAG: hypothetical protein E6I30_14275 [Chloroflexi bacterium]|nr:MAG: hypothetical protein E6I30_14275 [Chloroflexota bacterium]